MAACLALAIPLGGGALLYAWHPAIPPLASSAPAGFDPDLVRRGADLALIGDCRTCHTAPGGKTFAGGLAMPTPFGTIYSTNITPDAETGIGLWSETAFARAMREGVDREGRNLYPAFPYDHFTHIENGDVEALYAFFMTRQPVTSRPPPNDLPFPINVRLVLAGWKLLFLKERHLEPDPTRDAAWNRGRYLVEGLGHCGACHTPRNVAGAEEASRAMQGGEAEGWHAYALGAASRAPVAWSEDAMTRYLVDGFDPMHGVARGPMGPVAENLASVPRGEAAAMARYITSFGASSSPEVGPANFPVDKIDGPGREPQSAGSQAAVPAVSGSEGAQLYAAACASCHESGRPLPFGGISLSLSTAVAGESPENLVNIILEGLPATGGGARPVMPGFAASLGDADVLALANYLRARFGHEPAWTNLVAAVRDSRQRRLEVRPIVQAKD